MFQNLKIGSKLVLLIILPILLLAGIGGIAFFALNQTSTATQQLSNSVAGSNRLSQLNLLLQSGLVDTVNRVNTGSMIWEEGRSELAAAESEFDTRWSEFLELSQGAARELADSTLAPKVEDVHLAFDEAKALFESENRSFLSLFVLNDFGDLVDPFLDASIDAGIAEQNASELVAERTADESSQFINLGGLLIGAGILLAALLGFLIYRSISKPIDQIVDVVNEVNSGNFLVRTDMTGSDELGTLGGALDSLLEQRVSSLVNTEQDNKDLNGSILSLLDAVSTLSERDLTVQVPVMQDVTGPLADAINQLAEETGDVLKVVLNTARQVEESANTVNTTANAVNSVAENQQQEVNRTAQELAEASRSMNEIARVAMDCNQTAELTSRSTQSAVDSVTTTLEGMNEIREGVQETGKRMKRLGERSNEITAIVDIINTIGERTHVLALNASMQAAAAGDAGRGFAVVAEEVQRLAENARESTAQISKLVRNIQVDTTDTIATMDRTITQVVDGTRLAENAGQKMHETQQATARLVSEVQRIADGSKLQADISGKLEQRSKSIVAQAQQTVTELVQQLSQTSKMVEYAQSLLKSVNLFKLPD